MTRRRLGFFVAVAVVVALAGVAGTARGGTFGVPRAPFALPSAQAPNLPGSIRLPAEWTSHAAGADQRSYSQLEALWQRAGAAYGIQWQVLAAINKVESDFGRNMGPSSAGAVGWMQFMPDTWLRWGVDASGDGVADPWNADDAIFAAARYLAASGGATDIRGAVFSYNHADWYVNEVVDLASTFENAGADVAFQLDRTQKSLVNAERAVADANRRLVAARARVHKLAADHARRLRLVERATLLSDRLAYEKRATLSGIANDRAAADVARLEAELGQRRHELEAARRDTKAASFAPGAGALLAAPSESGGGYVFPVGGGAGVISVSHTHHDYPAADIAAPAGSPVYALADALVLRAWHQPDERCGIGMTIQTRDGREWTYCHLAYLEPSVSDGVALSAGAPVGLVGSTGHATGPHLHLQLQPPTSYPQAESWFERFAGSAFSWQDGGSRETAVAVAPAAPVRTDVFAGSARQRAHAASSDAVIAFTR